MNDTTTGALEHQILALQEEVTKLNTTNENLGYSLSEERARNKILCDEIRAWSDRAKTAETERDLLKRKLSETEKAGEGIRQKSSELLMERHDYRARYSTLMAAIGMTEMDDLAGGLDVIKQMVTENKVMKLGLAGIEVNADVRMRPRDKTTISRDGMDWKTFSEQYGVLLELCCAHGMIVVVLP